MRRSADPAKKLVPFVFTPIPRTFYTWLPVLSCAELRVYMAITDETLRFNKFSAKIPMTRLTKATSLHRVSISRATKELSNRGLLRMTAGKKSVTQYELLTPPRMDNVAPVLHKTEVHVAPALHERAI